MAKTQPTESPLEVFARRISDSISDAFSGISVSDEQPIASFPPESSDFIYVLNSTRGIPVRMGVVSGDAGKREINKLQKEAQALADAGMVQSYKYLNLASDRLATAVGRWISDLIGLALSGVESETGGEEETASAVAAPAQKRRGRPAGSGKKRRGRPRKNAESATTATEGETPKKRRGRPPGSGKKRGPGRPPKATTVSTEGTEAEAPKKRRGRPPGTGKKRGPGRPPKAATVSTAATEGEAPTKRRGRPPGSKNKSGAKRGPGHPPKATTAPAAGTEGEAPKRRRGRPPGSGKKSPVETSA